MRGDDSRARAVVRPSLPPMLWAVAALWSGVVLAERFMWSRLGPAAHDRAMLAVGILAALAAVCSCAWALLRAKGLAGLALAALIAGSVVGGLYWTHWARVAVLCDGRPAGWWSVEVLEDASEGPFGSRVRARVLDEGPTRGAVLQLRWRRGDEAPEMGARVSVLGEAKRPPCDDSGLRLHQSGVHGLMKVRASRDAGWSNSARGMAGPLRTWASAVFAREVPGPGGDLLAGVVLGDRRRLAGTQAEADFRTTGLTHLVAVSGSHLVVVAAVVAWVLSALHARPLLRRLGVATIVGAYVVFSGMQVSALRAWVMAIAAVGAWGSGRRAETGSVLAVAAGALLVVSPQCAFDLGFQLSVAAVAGLVLFARLFEAWLGTAIPGFARKLAAPFALTEAAQLTTLPITVSAFGVLSLIAPVANVLIGPIVGGMLLTGLTGLCVAGASPGLGATVLRVAGAAGGLAVDLGARLADVPSAAIPLASGPAIVWTISLACCLGLWISWPKPSPTASRAVVTTMLVATVLAAIGPTPTGTGIVVLDVGQGDAILVHDGPRRVLVDCGPSSAALKPALSRTGIRHLDAVVLTHMHDDHTGGLDALDELVSVDSIIVPAGTLALGKRAGAGRTGEGGGFATTLAKARSVASRVVEATAGDTLKVGDIQIEVLWPMAPVREAAVNEASLVMVARAEGFSALLTGDAESDLLDVLARRGRLPDVDVLKIGHHGSAGAVSEGDLGELRPECAAISVGAGNRFGHPRRTTLDTLGRASVRVLRTDLSGDIRFDICRGGYRVR